MSVLPVGFGSSGGVDIGDNIAYSCMFDSGASQYLSRTPGSAGNRKTWTWSGWVKRGMLSTGTTQTLFGGGTGSTGGRLQLSITNSNQLDIDYYGVGNTMSTGVLRDPMAYTHIMLACDTNKSSEKLTWYVNGIKFSTGEVFSTGQDTPINQAQAHYIGNATSPSYFLDSYLSNVHFIDGQALTPADFGRVSADTGQWVNKTYTGTYGTNGFKLEFADPSFATYGMGKDTSGNNNHWTPQGGITSANQYTDTPTNSFCVLNALVINPTLITKGNLTFTQAPLAWKTAVGSIPSFDGKPYFEGKAALTGGANTGVYIGACTATAEQDNYSVAGTWQFGGSGGTLRLYDQTTQLTSPAGSIAANDILQAAYDRTTGKLWFGKNNTWYDSSGGTTGNPSTGANPTMTLTAGTVVFPQGVCYANGLAFNFGARPFTYTPPTGFKSLCTANLPTPVIPKPSLHFQTLLDTGANIKTNLAALFTYYLDWIKDRANSNNHQLIDTVRGSTAVLQSNTTAAETTYVAPTGSSVGWAWNMGGSPVTNTAGSITSQVAANVLTGQSVVTRTGTGAIGTVGHGLSQAPELLISKYRTGGAAYNWNVYCAKLLATQVIYLDATNAVSTDATAWNSTLPTSAVFSVGASVQTNNALVTYVTYCFHSVEGYSKITSAVLNSSADGNYVDCGGKPAFILAKCTSTTSNWFTWDNKRSPDNPMNEILYPNLTNIEASSGFDIDATAGGFKVRTAVAGTWIFYVVLDVSQKYSTAR